MTRKMLFGCVAIFLYVDGNVSAMESKDARQKIVPLMTWCGSELLPISVAQRVVHDNEEGISCFRQIEELPKELKKSVTKWYEYMLSDIMDGDHLPDFQTEDEFYTTIGFLKASIDKMSSDEADSD